MNENFSLEMVQKCPNSEKSTKIEIIPELVKFDCKVKKGWISVGTMVLHR